MLTKFILSNGKHFYVEVPDEVFSQLQEASTKHKFLSVESRRFELVGKEEHIPVFKEADVLELKVASLARKVGKSHVKLGQSILESVMDPKMTEEQQVDSHIKNIGVKRDDPRVEKIRTIKRKQYVYPQDEAIIKVLWWEAKRGAFRDQLQKANVEISPSERQEEERSMILKILEELDRRITQAVRDYKSYPGE